jgi:hypothetical protein
MAFEPDKAAEGARQTANLGIESFVEASKQMQDLVNEMLLMSMDSMRHVTQTFDRMRSARSFEDIIKIQSDFVRESFEQFAKRSEKVATLATAVPRNIAKRSTDVMARATEQATQAVSHAVDSANDAARRATVGLEPGAPPPLAH